MKNKKGYLRRDFLKQSTLAGLGVSAITLSGLDGFSSIKSGYGNIPKREVRITSLAGLSLKQLHERYHNELFNRFLPAMESLAIDHEFGGFMCNVNILTREIINTKKKTWFQGRGIWVYSFLYNNLEKNPHYLEIAKKAIDFILKLKPKDDNFWNDYYSREGTALTGPGDIYSDLFVAEGLAEYSKATGEKQYLQLAKEIIFYCLERYDRSDYMFGYSYFDPGDPKVVGPRVLGHWMIFLSLSTQILTQEPDTKIKNLADLCIDAILKYHLNKEFNILNEVINHDMSLPQNKYDQFAIIGHGMETLSFIMAEAVRREDASLFQISGKLFKRHVEVSADKLYGGHFEILNNADKYDWAMSKSAWCQEEILIGTLIQIEHTGDKWAQECFSELDSYTQERMCRPDFAFWTFGDGRKVDKPDIETVEHYHTPRHLMRNMLALERIMKRGGKLSGLFG